MQEPRQCRDRKYAPLLSAEEIYLKDNSTMKSQVSSDQQPPYTRKGYANTFANLLKE